MFSTGTGSSASREDVLEHLAPKAFRIRHWRRKLGRNHPSTIGKNMGDKGSKDKNKREKQKKAQLSLKDKRRLKNEKKEK